MHFPKTEEGMEELRKRVAGVHADWVLQKINAIDCPTSQKLELLKAVIADTKQAQKGKSKGQER